MTAFNFRLCIDKYLNVKLYIEIAHLLCFKIYIFFRFKLLFSKMSRLMWHYFSYWVYKRYSVSRLFLYFLNLWIIYFNVHLLKIMFWDKKNKSKNAVKIFHCVGKKFLTSIRFWRSEPKIYLQNCVPFFYKKVVCSKMKIIIYSGICSKYYICSHHFTWISLYIILIKHFTIKWYNWV